MKMDGLCAVYCVVLIAIVAVEDTMALSGPPGSVCGSQCCLGWDQVGDTCMAHCYHPCEHGTCVDTNVCRCDPGWGGGDCSHDIDECWYETHICHHNCHNHEGCYTCSCDDGFQLINSTHCVNSTTANMSSTTTEMASLCTTAATSTVANPQQRSTRATASGLRTTPTAPTTTTATTTTAQQTQKTSANTGSGLRTTTTANITTSRPPQRTTRTTASGLHPRSTDTTTSTTTADDITTSRPPRRTTRTTASGLHPRSTATTTATTTTADDTTAERPQRTTALPTTSTGATSTADITTARRRLRTTRATTLRVTGPIVHDHNRSLAPRGGTDHQNVDAVIGVAVGAVALVLLLSSIGIFIFCKRRGKATSRQQQQLFSNLSPHPRSSLPGYTDTHWRNPAYENMYEEIPDTRSPPPPYEVTEGCGATGGFADLAVMSKGRLTDTNNVGVAGVGMPLAGTIPAVPSKAKENFSPLRNLHVDMQKERLPEDHGYEPLKKVPGNEYESLKRW
ncbi:spore coat protein SP65-like isoform X2 [Branchiostoma lanceolatum]|uniref:spore coat protein SP65-like isoform X2 n=1 Tax=Branchiostoma lanceolatum TaxID=7740 RepID=UPI0034531F32